ncbi:DeoR/GlpR family DNA-binding transcription regulator [Marinomonas ostreistagni]|uniref:DeoR/GlpR family DNA-binding transcription regulator n=1 Tax=Marinomonas ostreistagni TaxID=359209 RepID=UPI001950A2A6|nr:DeoR/GlpR family DNA-binding transcription regulator [Marinomonas ostreistagni]MBM6550931.1 DeoR/GlpR transcriptional regulator [Marinomonas ostreistagni]
MSLNERQLHILNWVQQCDLLLVEDMVERFAVSSQTIRKDINQLAERHLVRRQHGGIAPVSTAENLPFANRQHLNSVAKQAIAQRVAANIPNGASVFLGIGTTVENVAKALLDHQALQIFTNNLTVATLFAQREDISVRLTAGRMRHRHCDLVGSDAIDSMRKYVFDYGVLGCGGLHERYGVLDFDADEANISRTLIEQSRHTLLVADQHKWGRKASACVASFNTIESLFTDAIATSQMEVLESSGTQIITCTENAYV